MKQIQLQIPLKSLHNQSTGDFLKSEHFNWKQLKKVSYFKKLYNERKLKALTEDLFEKLNLPQKSWKNLEYTPRATQTKEMKDHVINFVEDIDQSQLLFDQPFLSFLSRKDI